MPRLSRLLALLACVCAGAAGAAALKIDLPKETAAYKPGPNLDLVNARCLTCHSADYVSTQPTLPRATWAAEVAKMKKVYGAPIADNEIDPLVDYFAKTYGVESTATQAPNK